jgi:hypothetical protein
VTDLIRKRTPMKTTDLAALPTYGYANPSDLRVRSNAMHPHRQLVQEIHRERLRQAQQRRLSRTALWARRALAQQLTR